MKFAVLDFETTGTSSDKDEIIQAGLVLIDEAGNVVKTFSRLVKPEKPIPAWISRLTGIDDALVADAPGVEHLLAELVPLLDDAVLVAHNVGFDAAFLQAALDRCGYLPFSGRMIDTVDLARIAFPTLPSYRLGSLTHSLNLRHDRPHQADSDAAATAEVFVRCLQRLKKLPLLTLQRIASLFSPERSDLGWLLAEIAGERETEFQPDEKEYQYYRQFALSVGDWTDDETLAGDDPDSDRTSARLPADLSFSDYMDSVQKKLRERLPSYEPRQGQEIMFGRVLEAFERDSHLLVEAGTGTGKSLGYLLPALYYGLKESKKIMVSTHTIQLQEQLRQRDLPLLQEALPVPFKAAVFKGRSNYLCLRKFEQHLQVPEYAMSEDEAVVRSQMTVWLAGTERGEAEELNLQGKAKDEWSAVASDADSCLNRSCPWFRKCFYHRSRNEAGKADLIITNHAMLFTDLRAENRLLPAYDRLIVDEAHHLEEVASHHLGQKTGYASVQNPLQRLWKDARTGLLPQLIGHLAADPDPNAQAWAEKLEEVVPTVHEIRESWDRWANRMFDMLAKLAPSDESGNLTLRLKPDQLPDEWEAAQTDGHNVIQLLSDLIRPLDKLLPDIREHADELAMQSLLTDLNGAVKDLAAVRTELQSFVTLADPDFVYWIEGHAQYRNRSVWMYGMPADVSGKLKEHIFDRKSSVVLTSATLTVDKSFRYVTEQLGLAHADKEGKLMTAQLPSPFNYREQSLVLIPRDFPAIRGRDGEARFVEELAKSLAEVAKTIGGRMLVLFTSYRMLKTVHALLKELLVSSGIEVMGQGIDGSSRSVLTRQFREQPASVLLGTSSFWEGVDIPGDALTCLAIVRLPFQPPNHPVAEAKSERLAAEKKNPFMSLSLPQAVIRFKQGFGRLVRTTNDKGIVVLYDTRVLETSYGKYFLYSLPGPKMEHLPTGGLVNRIREWLETPSGT